MSTTTTEKPTTKRDKTSATTKRDKAIIARVKAGEPLHQIGESYGLTGERVRQIGLTAFDDYAALKEYREQATNEYRESQRIEAAKAYAKEFPNATISTIGRQTNVPYTKVAEIVGPRDALRREEFRFREDPATSLQFSDEDCLNALRKASKKVSRKNQTYGVLTMDAYKDAAGAKAPNKCTIQNRFGSWKAACDAAGVPCGAHSRTYSKKWTHEDLVKIVQRFFRETGFVENPAKSGSMKDYTEWAAEFPEVPKTPTIRAHFGSWTAVKRIGEDLLPKERKRAAKR